MQIKTRRRENWKETLKEDTHTHRQTAKEKIVKERGRGKLQSAMQKEGNKKTISASAGGCMSSVDTPLPAFTHSNIHPHHSPLPYSHSQHCIAAFLSAFHCIVSVSASLFFFPSSSEFFIFYSQFSRFVCLKSMIGKETQKC